VTPVRCPIVELRQYTLHPGQRDVLIDLFDREFVESQEALGMAILGQFRDLDDPDRFVWLRGFFDMPGRAEALGRFYGGPVWRAHSREANATMVDSDDVLLLRPADGSPGFPAQPRPPANHAERPVSLVVATICHRDRPVDGEFRETFATQVRPALTEAGGPPLVCLQTEYAENTFPALPVRTGEHVFVWFTRFGNAAEYDDYRPRRERSQPWRHLVGTLARPPHELRLAPTARSLLR